MILKQILKVYFISASIFVHIVVILVAVYFGADKVTGHWRWPIIKSWFLGKVDKTDIFEIDGNNFQSIPLNQWVKIHQQSEQDVVQFKRQAHAGSAFDELRGRLVVFGSNTHAENWNNSIYSFDMNRLQWLESYSEDLPGTYNVNKQGVPVAGINNDHPWAMHTFGSVAYDVLRDNLIVASYPGHMSPDRYGKLFSDIWKSVKVHPTWIYDFKTKQWITDTLNNQQFFPYSVAYDTKRNQVVGFRPDGIFKWNGDGLGWKKIAKGAYAEWHTNVVFDSINDVFILFGGNELKNNIHIFRLGYNSTQTMPTPGLRPPAGQSIPLAFHKQLGKMVALIDKENMAQTWLYDYANDAWERLDHADFPYSIGMNYTMEYDPLHHLIILVSSPQNEETAVWVLRLL